jgi:alpha,alpha-trehalase
MESWESEKGRIRSAASVLIMTDFDGTLVEFKDNPILVKLPDQARTLLQDLNALPNASVAVVSGRGILDLVGCVGIPGLWYVGNHGYEIQSPSGATMPFYDVGQVNSLEAIARELAHVTRNVPGVHLELKGPILALHYRKVEPDLVPEVKGVFEDLIRRHHDRISMAAGKCTLEARLRSTRSKGTAVRFIRQDSSPGALPMYFGDDLTDIPAFEELKEDGIAVSVGPEFSPRAKYSLPGPSAVLEMLSMIRTLLREG